MVASARAHPVYSLIVPVRDRPEGIGRLLVTLRRQTVQGVFELVLVEDGSARPATVAVESHKSYFPIRHEFLSAEKGIGPAGARNRGAALAKGEYLVFVDSDVRLPDDYLYRIDKHLKDCPDGVFFGGNDRCGAERSYFSATCDASCHDLVVEHGRHSGSQEGFWSVSSEDAQHGGEAGGVSKDAGV